MTPKILPSDPEMAVRKMIDITQRLIVLMEDESRAVAMNDTVLFLAANKDKQKLADLYQHGAQEFHDRIEDFRPVEQSLIHELERAQDELGAITKANMDSLEKASIASA